MRDDDVKNAPMLAGWAIAAGTGLVGAAVSYVIVGIEGNGSVLVGLVLALVVGVILGLPQRDLPPPNSVVLPGRSAQPPASASHVPEAAPLAAAAPVATSASATAAAPASVPVIEAPAAEAATVPPEVQHKPPVLAAARDDGPDDLKRIRGIGPKLEEMLHGMGIYHFDQIAAWTERELAWVDDNLEGFKGRASRDGWVAQAQILAAGGSTDTAPGTA